MTDFLRAHGGATAKLNPSDDQAQAEVEGQAYPADYEAKTYARLNRGVALGPNDRLIRFTRGTVEMSVICPRGDAWRACAAFYAAGYTAVVIQ